MTVACLAARVHTPDVRRRLDAVVTLPTQETWTAAYAILLDGRHTLWELVCAYDPSFPTTRSSGTWPKIPDRHTIASAIAAGQPKGQP